MLLVADANLRRSKTDAIGSGTVVYTTYYGCSGGNPDWNGDDEGLVFAGLEAAQISRRIAAGDRPRRTGGGLLRPRRPRWYGGAPTADVMRQGRWLSPSMVAPYTKVVEAGVAVRLEKPIVFSWEGM